MAKAKKILITTELHEIFVVHDRTSRRIHRTCPCCGRGDETSTTVSGAESEAGESSSLTEAANDPAGRK